MSAKPVFLSRSDLLKRLRLTDSSDGDIQKIIDSRITEVRTGLYSELGEDRINELRSIGFSDSPETMAQVEGAKAGIIELKWVKAGLLRDLHVYFADNDGGAQQDWNDTGFLRDPGQDQEKTIDALMMEVSDGLEQLLTNDAQAKSQVRASSIGPEDTDPVARPGGSIY